MLVTDTGPGTSAGWRESSLMQVGGIQLCFWREITFGMCIKWEEEKEKHGCQIVCQPREFISLCCLVHAIEVSPSEQRLVIHKFVSFICPKNMFSE